MKKKKSFSLFNDIDYLNKLNPTQQAWLNLFLSTYYFGYKSKFSSKKNHSRYSERNSASNYAKHEDTQLPNLTEFYPSTPSPEDALIEIIDRKNKKSQK